MNANVLVIEDDILMAETLRELVRGWGLGVDVASNGEEGLDHLASQPVDLVLSDIAMPGMSGEEVLAKCRQDHPYLPVVLLTAHSSIKSAVGAMKNGAFDYVPKPFEPDELKVVVTRALEHVRLRRENTFLRAEMAAGGIYGDRLIGKSPLMLEVFDIIERVAKTDSTILISGETGTGKELVAQTIHFKSQRADKPLIAFNCASLNENLLESELFGHQKGAFTGAVTTRRGRFEEANSGTIFLDEISETTNAFQAKLLRVLQEGEIERVGDSKPIPVDVRVIASTNVDLESRIKNGDFRQDLFYRLRVVPMNLPALRDRGDDIKRLATHFVKTYSERYSTDVTGISPEGLDYLVRQPWEGNVRELQHTIERAVVLARSEQLEPADFTLGDKPSEPADLDSPDIPLQQYVDQRTAEHVIRVLDSTGWQKQKAADILGIDRATLYRILKKFSIEKGA